jgi:hypothetical protein
MKKTHWARNDFRIQSLQYILLGLENSINQLDEFCNRHPEYSEIFYSEEVEPIYGMAFIALQNYINGSIFDLFATLSSKDEIYREDKKIPTYERTRIELIIGLANYLKHRDDDKAFSKGTSNILKDFKLNFDDKFDEGISPIFEGYDLLTEENKISELIDIVKDWRKKLWFDYENQ